MSRYIDADKILYKDLSEGRGDCWVTFMEWIKEIPTADVRENVKGEWIVEKVWEHGETLVWKCSKCGKETIIKNYKFCPNCGADMRGDNNGKRNDS